MGIEIERKFLLRNDHWRASANQGTKFCQGYLSQSGPASVRVRIEGDKANINIKSANPGIHRLEYEYPVPLEEARDMLQKLCIKPLIEKTRYHVMHQNKLWEVDIFAGDNVGLEVAEIELDSVDEQIVLPDWVGEDVTDDVRYYNVSLVKHPYKDW